jgi:hypothetical protein
MPCGADSGGWRPAILDADGSYAFAASFDRGHDFHVRTSTDRRRRRVDHVARLGGLSRLRFDEDHAGAELGAMMRASIGNGALQGIAGECRADLAVVGRGVGYLAGKILGVQDAEGILDGGQERLQIDVEADASPTALTLEYGTPVYSVPSSKQPPRRFGIPPATGVPFHSRHDASVLDRPGLPRARMLAGWLGERENRVTNGNRQKNDCPTKTTSLRFHLQHSFRSWNNHSSRILVPCPLRSSCWGFRNSTQHAGTAKER